MKNVVRKLAACCLLLFAIAGSLVAQNDKPYVLKRQISGTDHYLSHVNSGGTWTLQDATSFNPETCIWYSGPVFNVSGTHHNYYFYDEVADDYHFLSAPLATNQDLGLSLELPTSSQLKNPDEVYYFYDWDPDVYGAGVARGHDDNGWWEVHWVAYSSFYNKWLTSEDHYHIVDSSAMFREVTVTEHEKYFNWTQSSIGNLSDFTMDYNSDPAQTAHSLSITVGSYTYYCTPAYTTYNFEGIDHNFQGSTSLGTNTPVAQGPISGTDATTYTWEISGEGAAYLSFNSTSGSHELNSTSATPSVYYTTENTQGRKTATLTLTMTFGSGDTEATVVRTATITVNTQCQNPAQASAPVILHNDVTVSWYPTATQYKVEWKKTSESSWSSAEVGNVTSYTIYNLDQVEYQYRVIAYCGDAYLDPPANPTGTFTPEAAPHLLIYGSVFGGGRAANVTGKTEVEIVNCDSIGAVYGGNDIAGSAGGNDGSVITLGVNGSGTSATILPVKIGSVYGGGNGYYAYGSTTFTPATASTSTIPVGDKVYAMSLSGQWTDSVWANSGTTAVPLPTITKTSITVGSDYVKVDSLFGGAKNAFVTKDRTDQNDVTTTNTMTTVNNGTIFAMFGGNNVGGTLGTARQKINVTNTKKDLVLATGTVDLGRTHGIGYLFGGGNLVAGTTTDINITGGQLDTIFGGGNRASVNEAWLTVNCAGTKRITAAQFDGDGHVINYGWDGNDIYNVHTLFGGNNRADMNGVPHITLTSGGVGTAYGGGNAGDMLAHIIEQSLDGTLVNYSTHMVLEEDEMIVDFLYGGCQMSNVDYSTWVEIKDGHVGTVYGGCNVSGDVGSKRLYPSQPAFNGSGSSQKPNPLYQEVQGATYVKVTGGTVYRDVYAGSNGYYHCNDGVNYVSGMNYGDPDGSPAAYDPEELYIGLSVPTHNETNVKIQGGHIKGNVYAGGNLACVGFTDYTIPQGHISGEGSYPQFVGMSFVEMSAGVVDGDVYGGGKMASVFGSNSVKVSGGTIGGALYGGNDRTGQVAQITNRVLPPNYSLASDDYTNLNQLNVKTYVRVTESANIATVYGGGNGDYIYDLDDPNHIQYCGITPDEPIQSNTFVDIDIDGGASGHTAGHIGTVYGGGNGVTVINGITVFLNVQNPDYVHDNVDVIFGGNNKGSLTLIPDIILLNGQVNTVYGGCNKGAMFGDYTITTGDSTYYNVGSLVRLRNDYTVVTDATTAPPTTHTATPTAKVSGAVYGGCRMNGVTNNSMVIVEGHNTDHLNAELFGGSDISGVVGGTSMVVVNGATGTQVGNVYGGGNGNYDYDGQNVYVAGMPHTEANLIATDTATVVQPYCAASRVDMLSGTANNLYAGGYAALSGTTWMNIVDGTVTNRAFGGGNLAGTETSYTDGTNNYTANGNSNVMVTGGTVNGGIFGGNNQAGNIEGSVIVDILGGTLGSSATPMTDGIFGGGYGAATQTAGNVTVNIDKSNESGAVAPIIYADVYGGSALGSVNDNASDYTTVNVLDGTLTGDIYGGGLGDADNPAAVYGVVTVNIGATDGASTPTYTGNATINGSVYGCNNTNGSPQDDVFVNIYKTAHGSTPQTNHYPDDFPSGYTAWTVEALAANAALPQEYAIDAVYGGGNLAAYKPAENKSTTVHVYSCDNTIRSVFGGGNAADVGTGDVASLTVTDRANTNVIIDGGRMHRVIGGGNGEDLSLPPANIFGTASTTVYAGLIDEVYGGANIQGSVDIINLRMSHPGNDASFGGCTGYNDEVYGMVFGCANAAPYNKSVTTTIECGVGKIGALYGGSNQNYIGIAPYAENVNVTLNLYGGEYENVFAGSRGTSSTAANIYGNVTLNLYGGTVEKAFGGCDVNGNIAGKITVNVLDLGTCEFRIDTIFGASNETPYAPTYSTELLSPEINVMYIQDETGHYLGNVFGGGNKATVTANPIVNIGYDASTMETLLASLVPAGWSQPANFPRAYVTHNAFGGGNKAVVNGTATVNLRHEASYVDNIFGGGNAAGATNTVVNVIGGTVHTDVYGGCNAQGTITEAIAVNVTGGTVTQDVFGGGKGSATATQGNILVTIDGGTVGRDVYGGSALGQVNNEATDLTKVWLKSGTITNNLYGGGMGQVGTSDDGQVNGHVEVLVDGGNVVNVFGCNNYNEAPQGTVTVTVNGGNMTNVFGGGNVAAYTAPSGNYPFVNIKGGTITDKVVGGGNEANVTGNTYILVEGGSIGTSNTGLPGIYGGCNSTGTVTGNAIITLTGGEIGHSDNKKAYIFGGGYGQPTLVTGDVTVNFGDNNDIVNPYPILHGELYGGSALGNVNTNNTNSTRVNIFNGTITGFSVGSSYDYGKVFGGGLGQKENGSPGIASLVNGKVYVQIGSGQLDDYNNYTGQATLINCNVFGCNNQNGSPQDEVHVDVFQTAHTPYNVVNNLNGNYAIHEIFGGGNESHYMIPGKKAVTWIHGCDNTIARLFGGGNAANVRGVDLTIDGGRLGEVFGGGNGEVTAADVGADGEGGTVGTEVITLNIGGGLINVLFQGSNLQGTVYGNINERNFSGCTELNIIDHFMGSNQTDIVGNISATINCGLNFDPYDPDYDPNSGDTPTGESIEMRFVNLYCGSNRAQIEGDVFLTIQGGIFENLFGGSKGRLEDPITPDIEEFASNIDGNVTLIITGGTIGNLYGGCDLNGNITGKVSINIYENSDATCPLFIGNIYGGGRLTNTTATDPTIISPDIKIIKGYIGGTTPNLPILHPTAPDTTYAGNVYGGGYQGDVTSNPRVIVGDGTDNKPVNVLGNVYGGGYEGQVNGSTQVIIVPKTYTFTYNAPSSGNVIRVTDLLGNPVTSGTTLGEGMDLLIEALPSAYGQKFNGWTTSGADAGVGKATAAFTTFTMGTENSTLTPAFGPATYHTLTITPPSGNHGTITVKDNQGGTVSSGSNISEGAVLNLAATPETGYKLESWQISGEGAVIRSTTSPHTIFTMGTGNASITATFVVAPDHNFRYEAAPEAGGTITVTNNLGQTVDNNTDIAEGTELNLSATAADGYRFVKWRIEYGNGVVTEINMANTTFIMRTMATKVIAEFERTTGTLTFSQLEHGTIEVFDASNNPVNSGASIPIGSVLTLRATPETNFVFTGWTKSAGSTSVIADPTQAETTMTMGTDTTISASFEEVQP